MNASLKIPSSVVFVPIMDRKRFAELVGISDDSLNGLIKRGQIPVISPSGVEQGRRSFVNVAKLMSDCMGGI